MMPPTSVRFWILTSVGEKLTAVIISALAFAGTEMLKLPSPPVLVPRLLPFTTTVAPAIEAPAESNTLPVIVRFCAATWPLSRAKQQRKKRNLLIRDVVLCEEMSTL